MNFRSVSHTFGACFPAFDICVLAAFCFSDCRLIARQLRRRRSSGYNLTSEVGECTVSAFPLARIEVDVADECLSIPKEPLLGRSQKNPISNQTSGTGSRTRARTHSHTPDIWPISHRLLCYLRLSSSSFVFPLRNQFDTCLNSQLKAFFSVSVTAAVT